MRQSRESLGKPRPLARGRLRQPALELIHGAAQRVDLVRLKIALLFQLSHVLLRGADGAQQLIEVGAGRQIGRLGDRGDQTASVILPALLADAQSVPLLEQGLQHRRQLRRPRHRGAFDQRRHQREPLTRQRARELVADHVAFVVQPRQVVGIRPARADHGHADNASRQRAVDLLAPLPDTDAMHIAEDPLTAERNPHPVVKPAARTARVVAPIADEEMVANHG